MSNRPNLLYVFADQLRYQSCGYAGDEAAVTPNLDAFAREGADFRQMVSCSPVCAAYRATLLTGLFATSHGMVINELRLHPNQRALGHVLSDAGYQTCYIGKWHLYANQLGHHTEPRNSFVPRGPFRMGFDGEWYGYNFHHNSYGEGAYYHTESPEKIHYGPGVYEPAAQTDLALDFMRRATQKDAPFTCVLSWGPPHDPWTPDNTPDEDCGRFADVPFPHPPNYKPENDPYADDWARLKPENREKLESWRRHYYAQTTSLDTLFARLLRGVDELGLCDNTLVVFTSDHGECFGAHGRRAKNIFYDEAIRVPFLMRWPEKIPAGQQSDACLSSIDLLPTLLGLLELDAPEGIEGEDFSHLALGKSGPEPLDALLQGTGPTAAWGDGHEWRAVRDQQFTYARYRRDGAEMLFDHRADPYQLQNLATDATQSATLERLRARLAERLAAINDSFEACSYYEKKFTDGDRNIVRTATRDFGPMPAP